LLKDDTQIDLDKDGDLFFRPNASNDASSSEGDRTIDIASGKGNPKVVALLVGHDITSEASEAIVYKDTLLMKGKHYK